MSRLVFAVSMTLFMATSSQAASVLQKSCEYRYEVARDIGSDREYVICSETLRTPLALELKQPPLSLRFGNYATVSSTHSTPASTPPEPLSRTNPSGYHLKKIVLFDFDSARVEDGRGLSLLAGSLKTDPSVTGIRIKGFTCDIGTKDYNDRLAMRRAVAVGNLLGKAGLQVNEVSGEGKCCYVPGEGKLSRRVEISVMRSLRGENNDEK